MQSHPVPQPISTYEFRLIGSMTIKQFGKLAGASLVGLFFYAFQPIPSPIRLGLLAIFVLLGLGLAFLPINERPLDAWIIAFVKSAFSPTQYIWRKNPLTTSVTKETSSYVNQAPTISKSTVSASMTTVRQDSPPKINLDLKEKQLLESFYDSFNAPLQKPKIRLEPVIETKTTPIIAKTIQDGLPYAPSEPNIIYGVIKDREGKLVPGAILEIKDERGFVVRALRSNKIGQFRTATPLDNGVYEISIEKEGLNFDIIKLNLNGGITPPVEINQKE